VSNRESNPATIRIAVADDHPVVRDGLVAMLETQPDFEIVGNAATGADAVALVESSDPDVLLLDLEMPVLDGVGVLRRLRAENARVRVIVFTVFDTDERIIAAVEAGAAGYLLKGAPRADVFAAVRVVAGGGSLAPLAASAVLRRVRRSTRDVSAKLTPRERSCSSISHAGLATSKSECGSGSRANRELRQLRVHEARRHESHRGHNATVRRGSSSSVCLTP
jgi:DNA-binding NarL/FixJ family response regulator